ncbi:MAG: VF530 family protein [Porticoccaceae bacterium]|jgi:uncharacterized protein (DUF2132 family)
MSQSQAKNPLHGITLEQVVTQLANHYGWDALGAKIAINCFKSDPSVKSSLKFLRKTAWAREKVEALYIKTFSDKSVLNADASGASNLWTSGAFKKN